MQTHAPEAIDISKESAATRKLYGVGREADRLFRPAGADGAAAGRARRAVRADLLRRRQLRAELGRALGPEGQPRPALRARPTSRIAGLHQGSEEPRPVRLDADRLARRVRPPADLANAWTAATTTPHGFSVWLAGGGVKGGTIVGATDRYGYQAVENKKSVYDLHATILHLLGLDHEKLTYRFNGRDMRLTDVHGQVIKEVVSRAVGLSGGWGWWVEASGRGMPRPYLHAGTALPAVPGLLAPPGLPALPDQPAQQYNRPPRKLLMMKRCVPIICLMVVATLTVPLAAQQRPGPAPSIDDRTNGMKKLDGYFPLYWDERSGSMFLEIPRFDTDFLFTHGPFGRPRLERHRARPRTRRRRAHRPVPARRPARDAGAAEPVVPIEQREPARAEVGRRLVRQVDPLGLHRRRRNRAAACSSMPPTSSCAT